MTVFVDKAVIMYAGGADHPMRDPSQRLLEAAVAGRIDAVTSAEVIQEIHRRFTAIGVRDRGVAMAEAALEIFDPVLPISNRIMRRMTDLVMAHGSLSARDLVHVATCAEAGIEIVISPDRGFDDVDGLARIDPLDAPGALL